MRLRYCVSLCGNVQGHLQLPSSVQIFDIAFIKKFVFVVHFLNAFWHGNKAFPKGSSQNEIVPSLKVFHFPYSKYKGVKMCFYSYRYQNQTFSLVSHSCRTCVALVSHSCSKSRTRVARVLHSCCKLDQIGINRF